jgi:hypothetical protein
MNKKKAFALTSSKSKTPRAYTPPFTLHKANRYLLLEEANTTHQMSKYSVL